MIFFQKGLIFINNKFNCKGLTLYDLLNVVDK